MLVAGACALLLTDFNRVPEPGWRVGEVATRDIRAPFQFRYIDQDTTDQQREDAARAVPEIYQHDDLAAGEIQARVASAFELGRARFAVDLAALGPDAEAGADEAVLDALAETFVKHLGLAVRAEDARVIADAGFSPRTEAMINELIGYAGRRYIVANRSVLPATVQPIAIHTKDGRSEAVLSSYDEVLTADQAREGVLIYALQHFEADDARQVRAASAVARAGVHGNVDRDQLATLDRRGQATAAISDVVVTVDRGTTIVRQGDIVTGPQLNQLLALRDARADKNIVVVIGSIFAFCVLLLGSVNWFSKAYIKRFVRGHRDLEAVGLLVVVMLLLARLVVGASTPLASASVEGIPPSALWYAVPVAGGALLVRILINAETSLVFAVIVSTLCGLMMEQSALFTVFFVVSSITAAGAIGRKRERKAILLAGVITGVMNAAFVLVLALLEQNLGESVGQSGPAGPLVGAAAGFIGGVLASFLVLGLVPLFELLGFDTDLKLLELANLDHPLLRNLMLRAPGSYHHSVMVGTLAEAAAEAIGANALQARVASYFHDIGKAVRPHYFIENQRDGVNRHERLTPHQSARVIIDHVREGGAIARKHKLPRIIVDNIYMHHGTGRVNYFFLTARERDPNVDPADFSYPGPKPNTREAGLIMLADKIEAACRSIREPSPENVTAMIQRIINSVMAEGQFDECPLTVKEVTVAADVFKKTILAIHHHRIEYPEARTADAASDAPAAAEPVITLEIPAGDLPTRPLPEVSGDLPSVEAVDYESPEYLPQHGNDGR